jgi:hypothetical protein
MGRFKTAARKAATLTNKELADEIAGLSTFNRDRLRELLPTKREKEEFVKLMAEVEAETAMDQKLAYLTNNLQTAGKVVFKVLKSFI